MPTQQVTEQRSHRSVQAPSNTQPPGTTFIDLPPELRNEIYKILVLDLTDSDDDWNTPSLAFANRQLRHEVLPTYYANTHVWVGVQDGRRGAPADASVAKRFTLSIGANNVRCLHSVTLQTQVSFVQDYAVPLRFLLSIKRMVGNGVVAKDDVGGGIWEHDELYDDRQCRAIEASKKEIGGRMWSEQAFLKALGGLRKLKAKAVINDREYVFEED
ncbi:hypothetical protein B0A48_06849 [Cryoendolithus antarcticus]|uniref:F-box domain-containing protein n=1 Tax=Cryoendolithus antarcticus TaxID=1507870 RepID=A0A1V8T9H5_9PEZI|nr:hypothetical protein B0A48_06849 [Cryoendolithus antarcticus]